MTPSKEELEAKARHFANTVFVIAAGLIMLAASLLQPLVQKWMGEDGGHLAFLAATVAIFALAGQRSRFALYAIERQCAKYGHVPKEGSPVCGRCLQTIPDTNRPT